MHYADLRGFLARLEALGELKRIAAEIDPCLEMTEICDRVLKSGGPALLFERPKGYSMPVLANLFGTSRRVALGMGRDSVDALRELGQLLAYLKEPEPPKGLKDAWQNTRPLFMQVMQMAPKEKKSAPCQEIVWEGNEVDLGRFPVQTCWPGDAGPLITWGLTVTRGPHKTRQNLGIYRQQVIASNKVIMRWLAHRGGALDFRDHAKKSPGEPFPIAVALGADPATILGAVTPVPDTLSEYQFAGLLRGARTDVARCLTSDLQVPAVAEIVLEGAIEPDANDPSGYETSLEGPFGDHTGYYNEVERPAAVGQPTHDHAVLGDDLLSVDAEVLPAPGVRQRLRAPRDDKAPGDQRSGVARPACLDRQHAEIDVGAFADLFLAGAAANPRRLHVPQGLGHL